MTTIKCEQVSTEHHQENSRLKIYTEEWIKLKSFLLIKYNAPAQHYVSNELILYIMDQNLNMICFKATG